MNQKDKIKQAVEVIAQYGWIDGGHHKQWVLDQALRVLLGTGYAKFIEENFVEKTIEPDGTEQIYNGWDVGIAP